MTLREFCIALLATTVTAPTTVAVVKHREKAKVERTSHRPKPAQSTGTMVRTWDARPTVCADTLLIVPRLEMVSVPQVPPVFDGGNFAWVGQPWTPPGGVTWSIGGTIPEPGQWFQMLAGFGLVGAGLRWRRRVHAV